MTPAAPQPRGRTLLIAGTTSDAGKSTLVAGLCRHLRRQGVRVAPFKAQNMSNNSVVVTGSDGRPGEIGRAQAMQAAACGLVPSTRFNPVLLKPGSDMRSQVIVDGRAVGDIGAGDFAAWRPTLANAAYRALDRLREEFDVVICEGAGSPAEINLRAGDFVNMGLARHARMPVIVTGDIDRGGVFAALYGTVALLDREDQALVAGFVINKFRGDVGLLRPGVDALETLTGRPTYGVLPWHPDIGLDGEDSLSYVDGRALGRPAPPLGTRWLRVAAIRLPRVSNATDLEALAAEPGVIVRITTSPADVANADLVVIPGSKATVDDLDWMRATGLADAVTAHAAAGRPLLGICGGFQMLAERIHDRVESGRGTVAGLGLLPIEVTFDPAKTLARVDGTALGEAVSGYEIHHGRVSRRAPDLAALIGDAEGARTENIYGTHWHGAFESDGFRRAFLTAIAPPGVEISRDTVYADRREHVLDLLADLVGAHLDTAALDRLIAGGAPAGMTFLPPGAPPVTTPNRACG